MLTSDFLKNHRVLSCGPCTAQTQLGPSFMKSHSDLQIRHSATMLPTIQHCHGCQDVAGSQGLPSWGEGTHSAHADQTRELRGVRAGAGGVLPVPLSGPHLATSWEGKSRNLRPARRTPGPQTHRDAEGKENSLRPQLTDSSSSARTGCALNFHFHCWLLSAIHNAKVNSNTGQFGRHENTHQSAKKEEEGKKKLSKFLGLFLDPGWPHE